MLRLVVPALAVAMFGFSSEASAQVDSKTANLWAVHTTQKGCKVVISVGAMYGASALDRVTWSGGCGRNGLAEGQGELGFFFHEGPTLLYADYHGSFAGGLMQGAWKFASWERSGSELSGSGIYNYLSFQDGCMVSFEQTPVRSPCRMITGRATAANAVDKPATGVNPTPIAPRSF